MRFDSREWAVLFVWNRGLSGRMKGYRKSEGKLTNAEWNILMLLRGAIAGEQKQWVPDGDGDWPALICIAQRHAILPLLYDQLSVYSAQMGKAWWEQVETAALQSARQYYYLLWLTARVTAALSRAGLSVVVLKGAGVAAEYPVPAYRKAGDIDLFLQETNLDCGSPKPREEQTRERIRKAASVLTSLGFVQKPGQTNTYHTAFVNDRGVELELHSFLTEPLDRKDVNEKILRFQDPGTLQAKMISTEGQTIPVFEDGGQAFTLMLHMLHHFLRSGFGLKLLTDWVVFWNRGIKEDQKEVYHMLVHGIGIGGFSDLVTSVCIRYLGLTGYLPEKFYGKEICEDFIKEILQSGEFGEDIPARTAIPQGTGLSGYFREFHHRTRLNFPKASHYPVLFPLLWTRTLFRFLINNCKVRRTSLCAVLRESAKRSRFMGAIHLFRDSA
ncbi:MAG: nucleotidyltransferase family protein [Bilifractor sp.]